MLVLVLVGAKAAVTGTVLAACTAAADLSGLLHYALELFEGGAGEAGAARHVVVEDEDWLAGFKIGETPKVVVAGLEEPPRALAERGENRWDGRPDLEARVHELELGDIGGEEVAEVDPRERLAALLPGDGVLMAALPFASWRGRTGRCEAAGMAEPETSAVGVINDSE